MVLFLLTALLATSQPDRGVPQSVTAAAVIAMPYTAKENRLEVQCLAARDTQVESVVVSGKPEEILLLSKNRLLSLGPISKTFPAVLKRIGRDVREWAATDSPKDVASRYYSALEDQLWISILSGTLNFKHEDIAKLSLVLSQISYPQMPPKEKAELLPVAEEALRRINLQLQGFNMADKTTFIAALFAFRESIEACVVILAIFIFVRKVTHMNVRMSAVLAGIASAVLLSVFLGFCWNFIATAYHSPGVYVAFGVISVVLLLFVTNASIHPLYFGRWMSFLRGLHSRGEFWASFLIPFIAILREGFEMSLSMTTLSMEVGWYPVIKGLVIGFPAGVLAILLLAKFFNIIGQRKMLIASGAMMVVASASFTGLFVSSLIRQGVIAGHPISGIDIALWSTILFGVSGNWEGVIASSIVVLLVTVPWLSKWWRDTRRVRKN